MYSRNIINYSLPLILSSILEQGSFLSALLTQLNAQNILIEKIDMYIIIYFWIYLSTPYINYSCLSLHLN